MMTIKCEKCGHLLDGPVAVECPSCGDRYHLRAVQLDIDEHRDESLVLWSIVILIAIFSLASAGLIWGGM